MAKEVSAMRKESKKRHLEETTLKEAMSLDLFEWLLEQKSCLTSSDLIKGRVAA